MVRAFKATVYVNILTTASTVSIHQVGLNERSFPLLFSLHWLFYISYLCTLNKTLLTTEIKSVIYVRQCRFEAKTTAAIPGPDRIGKGEVQ